MTIAIAIVGGLALFAWLTAAITTDAESDDFTGTDLLMLIIVKTGFVLCISLFVLGIAKNPGGTTVAISIIGGLTVAFATITSFFVSMAGYSWLAAIQWPLVVALFILALVK